MAVERIPTLVIGGGQAGLTMSHRLKQRGLPHLVLERHRIAERWRSERWDGLTFQFPNWSVKLPDFPFPHENPDGFATTQQITAFIDAYAAFVAPPVRCGVAVTKLRRGGDARFIAETSDAEIEADNVVIATGPYQRALVPDLLRDHTIFQLHASRYANPEQLPKGAVLVVGAGASGAQIAEELLRAGRHVYLSVGRHTRLPRRYRGRDLTWWFDALGFLRRTPEERGPPRPYPTISGAYGGHTVDLRRFANDGIVLLGRLRQVDRDIAHFGDDLAEHLAYGDAAYAEFLGFADEHVRQHGLSMPPDPAAREKLPDPPCVSKPLRQLDLAAAGIGAVIWATGYGVDFGWIDLPVLDRHGEPLHDRGVTEMPGLYFLGLPWLTTVNSSFLAGVGDDAATLAAHIAERFVKPGRP
jgi:putative flavoprotein involved in K+ transport